MSSDRAAKLIAFPGSNTDRNRSHEREFLPAALEIIETPVSPIGRITMTVIIALVSTAIVWACVGKIDIIATATGRIIPSGQVKLIQPLEIGVVKTIHVADGDHVHAGDILIELDPTTNAADARKVSGDLMQAEVDAARLNAALSLDAATFEAPPDADPVLVAAAQRQLVVELSRYHAKIEGLDHQIAEKTAERDQAKATIVKVAASLPLVEQRNQIYRKLRENEFTSRVAALQSEQDLVDAQNDRAVALHQLEGAEAAIAALAQQRRETDAEYREQTMDDLAKAKQKIVEQGQDQIKATQRTSLQTLRAPVDGTVEQLAAHTVGGVVTPAETLMVVVPEGSRLEVEAMLPNREVGFVHADQPAEVKVEAFTYTRYGLLHGRVEGVSRDAVRNEHTGAGDHGRTADSPKSADAGNDTGDSAYVARVSLAETAVDTEQGRILLEPGMAVTAEIKTGQRRVIEYLLSPLLRYRHEGLRER